MIEDYKVIKKRYQTAQNYGFVSNQNQYGNYYIKERYKNALDEEAFYVVRNKEYMPQYLPKPGSSDDGPVNGPFLGGIGNANFSRDMKGYFSRWQLQQGVHLCNAIDTAFFMLRWENEGKIYYKKIRIGEDGFKDTEVKYTVLFPKVYEKYNSSEMPFELILEYYSPMIPHNYEDSILPLTIFNFHVIPKSDKKTKVSIGFCWPNLLGWKQEFMTSEQRQDKQWPTHQNAGNSGKLVSILDGVGHILQTKATVNKEIDDMHGHVMISIDTKEQWEISYDSCFRESRMTTGFTDEYQWKTIGKVEHDFKTTGKLSMDNTSWEAHWHEPISSAFAADTILDTEKKLSFVLTLDIPTTVFGMGRKWNKAYTEKFTLCNMTKEIAEYAVKKNEIWLHEIDNFHQTVIKEEKVFSEKVIGAKINELYFVNGGGSVLVRQPTNGYDKESSKLGNGTHYGLLEGIDTGYYYYNTLDLWVYAFASLSNNWPELAKMGFNDYLESAKIQDEHENMIYRDGKLKENLLYGKLPHDLGSVPEDLFVRLNGYNFRDNPNMWKDHNPSFVGAFYYHKQLCNEEITKEEFQVLKIIMDYVAKQDIEDIGIPRHTEFGDSTWDNLDMKGISIYSGCLCVCAWAIMKDLANKFNDDKRLFYENKLNKSKVTIEKLWNGKYYNTNEKGKYKKATMTDSLLGVLYAKKIGIKDLLPEEQIKSHLLSVYENNVKAYHGGKFGALLVAEPGKQKYEKDGGDELQVNEVLVGSTWILVACLKEFGFEDLSKELAVNVRNMIYDNTGLQFRTPAAWSSDGKYRAPMNMRPLSIWFI